MSRPRRNVQPVKYVVDESDGEDDHNEIEIASSPNSDSEESSMSVHGDDDASEVSESFPIPIPITTKVEVEHARALVAEHRQKVAALQARYEEQKGLSESLEAKVRAAQRILFETEATIAPISRVPPEVLGLIFTIHTHEHQQSPWILMHISRAWRAAALMTRSIWGRILLAPPGWARSTVKRRTRVFEGMEVCLKPVQLNRALKRAGAAPIDLRIIFTHDVSRVRAASTVSRQQEVLLELLKSIFTHQANARLRSLSVVTDWNFSLPTEIMTDFDYTNLVSLTLDKEYAEVAAKVAKESRGLRSLNIRGSSLNKMAEYKRWSSLEELQITSVHEVRDKEVVRRLLSAPDALTKLRLSIGVVSEQDQGDPPILIPSLTNLELHGIRDLWPVDCPNLTHLTLRMPPFTGNLPNESIHLPHLVELVYVAAYSAQSPLRVFVLPSLQTFEFQCTSGKAACGSALKSIWPSSISKGTVHTSLSNIEPRTLIIRNALVNEKLLARALAGRSKLEELVAVDISLSVSFFQDIMPATVVIKDVAGAAKANANANTKAVQGRKKTTSAQNITCASLKRLEIDLVSRQKIGRNQEGVEASAKALIAARANAGCPLERLAMRFSKDEGWKDLVQD